MRRLRYCTLTFLCCFATALAQLPKVASTNATGPNGSLIGRNGTINWLYIPVDANGYMIVDGLGGGGGGGGGPTLSTNGTNNGSQTVLNFLDTASIAFTNPASTGNESAAIKSTGTNTVMGWNGSNALVGFTAGAGISLAGGQISATGTTGIFGSLATNCMPKGTNASTVTCSSASDNGTTVTFTDPGGITLTTTTAGISNLATGTGAIPGGLAANSFAWVGPSSGGTSYGYKACPTAASGYIFAGAPFVGTDNINELLTCPQAVPHNIPGGVGPYGSYTAGTFLAGEKAQYAGHFVNIQVTNTSPGTCSSQPIFNVQDYTTSTTGTGLAGSSTGAPAGTTVNGSQNLTFAAGDSIGVYVSTNAPSCGAYYGVTAQVVTP